ncbi:methylenetetrahydrofolate reductase [Bifidobacterium bombi]|uniref:Methylenetetrahydrofolate reductase n=1 Tax=Bifidobacterium bombi DSM 19703 TaxID=1341695 RepID=A0A080N201_9BIFI|nr:methylenetetrahydrofolate reductase [Bifidobacterium bombi]KFF30923.1 5,10-methylenetetrahydrofolate reductase [Bifidobacterium bombi DSM 19703]
MHSPIFSLEVFPPNTRTSVNTIYDTMDGLKEVEPDFVSVTYGHGAFKDRTRTACIAATIHNEYGFPVVAHLTALYSDEAIVDQALQYFHEAKVAGVLALRGDPVEGNEPCGVFEHASDLVAYIRSKEPGMPVFGACYPEGHVECSCLEEDIANLKRKVDAGATHLLSQLFYKNDDFYRFLDLARGSGIEVPIEAGIMPVVNVRNVETMNQRNSTSIAPALQRMIDRWGSDPKALRQAGVVYASEQIADLVAHGVDGVHLYTMNRPSVARSIWQNVEGLFGRA